MSLMKRCLLALLMLAATAGASAQELHPLVSGSLKEIVAARQGRPFILGLWSLTCTHCRDELAMLASLKKKYPALDLVLVSTDTPADRAEILATLQQAALGGAQAWVFADDFAERLRFEIDPKWHGELPRSYLYDAARFRAFSGKPDPRMLEQWVADRFGQR